MTHWTEQDFLDWIYGLRTDTAHLEECPECEIRGREVAERRRQSAREPEISWDFLAAQRRRIYERLEHPVRNWVPMRWAVSVAMLLLAVILSLSLLRSRQANLPLSSPADEKLFSELNSIEQSNEPRAIEPIRNLFEE